MLYEVITASHKSYRPRDEDGSPGGGGRNPTVDFHGEKRSRDTHESKTDPDAYLFKKSKGSASKLAYMGHLLMENRVITSYSIHYTKLYDFGVVVIDIGGRAVPTHAIRQTLAGISQDKARDDADRIQNLYNNGAATRESWEHAKIV